MFCTTLQVYKDSFQARLDAYLDEYEDNVIMFFLENELVKYKDYTNALIVFQKDFLIFKDKKSIKHPKHSGINRILENYNKDVYNDIVTEIINPNADPKLRIWNDEVSIDLVKLQNYINSSMLILELIEDIIASEKNQKRLISTPYKLNNVLQESKFKASNLKEDNKANDWLKSTIEDYLEEFKENINGNGYEILVDALVEYFKNGVFPILKSKINFKKINKKKVGWALKELYKSQKTENLDIEYFRFANENINLFAQEIITTENFNKSNFYKIFTTNPDK